MRSITIFVVCTLLSAHLSAQEPDAPAAQQSRLDAGVSADSNHGGDGTWLQLTPGLGYAVTPRWSVEAGVPVYYLSAGATYAGTSAVGGIGDAYVSLSLDMSPSVATFYTTLTSSAPTGSSDKGLGAGQVSWDWTTHLAGERGRFGPYVNGGLANNIKTANESLRLGAGTARAGTGVSVGNLAHAETGVEIGLWKSLTLTASGYGVFGLQGQITSTAATPGAPRLRPGGNVPRPGAAARRATNAAALATAASVSDDVSDHGFGLVLWGQVTPSVDLSLWISHSLVYTNYTTVSVSATYSLTPPIKSRRSGSRRT